MDKRVIRGVMAVVVIAASLMLGYAWGKDVASNTSVVTTASSRTTRVVYSLDQMRTDQELVALITAATSRVYFAVYTFTLESVADALVEAKRRGLDVRGLVDHDQSEQSFQKPIIDKLVTAGIPILTEHHSSGRGIMHLKLLVTDRAYALGSYNWTTSATRFNDEILEIGTDPSLRATYESLLRRLFDRYAPKP